MIFLAPLASQLWLANYPEFAAIVVCMKNFPFSLVSAGLFWVMVLYFICFIFYLAVSVSVVSRFKTFQNTSCSDFTPKAASMLESWSCTLPPVFGFWGQLFLLAGYHGVHVSYRSRWSNSTHFPYLIIRTHVLQKIKEEPADVLGVFWPWSRVFKLDDFQCCQTVLCWQYGNKRM